MSREIKFKVFTDEKKMIGPFDLSQNPIYWNDLRDGIRLQFTGLHDKNGVEIYEGDVLKFDHLSNCAFENKEVTIFQHSFCADEYLFYEMIQRNYKFKVIGNKYENPELLK